MHFKKRGRVYLPELFEQLGKVRTKKQRKEMLQEYAARDQSHLQVLRGFVECTYHPAVVWALPEGNPPYRLNDKPDYNFADTNLFNVMKKIRLFLECQSKIGNTIKREMTFIKILEGLHPKEAKILIAMKNKETPDGYRGVSETLFREAFPTWLPEEVTKKD